MGDVMRLQSNLTESECFAVINHAADLFMSKKTESAVAALVDHLRAVFGVSCVCVRETLSRPCSLRFTYESVEANERRGYINQTFTFDENVWDSALAKFSQGHNQYRAGGEANEPLLFVPVPRMPMSMIQIPMYNDIHFFGVLELLTLDEDRDWSESELSALKVCAALMCQSLYRLNSSVIDLQNNNDRDSLTGLMDFRVFTEKLDRKLSELLSDSPVAVIYTDIHHFKYINETYGYKRGDEVLKLIAQAMMESSKGLDVMICRAYADHFISASPVNAEYISNFDEFINEQNQLFAKLLQENCPDVRIRMSSGICYVHDANATAATAIAHANLARKVAKAENIRKPLVFSDSMMEDIKYQEYLNIELPRAIKNRDLKVYYQPKINCVDDSLYGAEALIRWQKPDGSFIYPDKFIPVFEKNGNIIDVDFYVYKEVFRYIRGRIDAGLPVFPISMNVSRVHFHTNRIIPYIEGLLKEYNVPPELVEFELTENIYMKNFSKANDFIKSCRSHGIQVSMDDFGSGYSSLNVISALSIDTLKIDRVFLKSDDLSDNDKTVIESTITMAKRLGMKVICEGVETEAQTVFLKNANCDQIQGYYYGKPMDEDSFNKFAEKMLSK